MKNLENKTINNLEELSSDLTFIEWVKNDQKGDEGIWKNRLSENFPMDEVEQAIAIVQNWKFSPLSVPPDAKQDMWEKIEARTRQSKPTSSRIVFWRTLSIAASFGLLLIAAWVWLQPPSEKIWVQRASRKSVQLPDQSIVVANAESELTFDKKNWKDNRVVSLRGEAFFEVEKGNAFCVKTDLGEIRVLGTSFNVFSRSEFLEVTCYTGKVQVSANGQQVILTPNQKAVFTPNDDLKKEDFWADSEKLWTNGTFYFDRRPLSQVLKELERQYDITIRSETSSIEGKMYSGFFSKGDLDKALQAVCWPMKLTYNVEDKQVLIFTKK